MTDAVHIYCDESCHLEHDGQRAMVLGAVSCSADARVRIGRAIKKLKIAHGIPANREVKWTQVSPSRLTFYLALVDLFFDTPELGFRAVVIPDKDALDHGRFGNSHDDFYYKMWWQLLRRLIDDQHVFRVFVDIKDTHSAAKLTKLHDVLCHAEYDFNRERIQSVEAVRSDEVPLVQLADVLIGVLSYRFRGLGTSVAKQAMIERVLGRSGLGLERSTLPSARKFNLFVWQPKGVA